MDILLGAIIGGILGLIGIGVAYNTQVKAKQNLKDISEQHSREQQQRQQAEQSLKDTNRKLMEVTEQVCSKQEQYQQLEQSLEAVQRDITAISEQLSNEKAQRQQLEQSLADVKRELATSSEQLTSEQAQRQQLEQSLEETKLKLVTSAEQLTSEQAQRQQLEQSLEETKLELVTSSEQLTSEQAQRQQLEQSLEDTKRELATSSEQFTNEQAQRQQLEQALEETKKQLLTPPSSENDSERVALSPEKIYCIKSLSSGKVLHVPQGSSKNSVPIIQDNWRSGQNQQWQFQPLKDEDHGYYQIFSVKSKKCLDVSSKSLADNAEIHQFQCLGDDHQKWKLIVVDKNLFIIQCKHSKKVLTVSSETGKIIQYTQHEGNNQRWILTEV